MLLLLNVIMYAGQVRRYVWYFSDFVSLLIANYKAAAVLQTYSNPNVT
jgi:hypothetical protein